MEWAYKQVYQTLRKLSGKPCPEQRIILLYGSMLEEPQPVETNYHSSAQWNIERLVRNSCSQTRRKFGPTRYGKPTITPERAARLSSHALVTQMCGVDEDQTLDVRTAPRSHMVQFDENTVIPDPHLAKLLTTPITYVDGLTAKHSVNLSDWIRGEFPSGGLEPNDYETTVSNWMKKTIEQRYNQLQTYMEGRHTWDELREYWARLVAS